jgi:hypothetical protein
MVALQGESSGLGGRTAVGRSRHTNHPSRPPWAVALQRPGAAPGPALGTVPPPRPFSPASLRHRRHAPGDAAAARAGLPRRDAAPGSAWGAAPPRPPCFAPPPPRSRVAYAADAAAATADGPGCSAWAALGSSAVGRWHTNQTSRARPPWAAALQHPGAAPWPARRAAPPPPSPQRAPPRHHRRAPRDAAAARAGLPHPGAAAPSRAPPQQHSSEGRLQRDHSLQRARRCLRMQLHAPPPPAPPLRSTFSGSATRAVPNPVRPATTAAANAHADSPTSGGGDGIRTLGDDPPLPPPREPRPPPPAAPWGSPPPPPLPAHTEC